MTEHRTRIDDAIDRAVRDMLRRDPPAGFRRRVLSRLQAPARRSFLWPGLAAAATATAIVAVTQVAVRDVPKGPVSSPPHVASRVPANPPAAPPVSGFQPGKQTRPPEPIRQRAPRQQSVRTATFGPRDGRVSATSLRERGSPVAPTAEGLVAAEANPPAALIAPTPVPDVRPLEVAPIVVPPIQIAPLRLAPLSPPR